MAEQPDIFAPTPDAQVQQPQDTFRQQASQDAFGAAIARGGEQLGTGVTHYADFWQQVQTDHVTNDVLQRLSDINESSKLLKGQDALDAQASTMQSAQDAISQARGQLKTPTQQLAFDNATKNMWFRYFQPQLNNHFNEQGQAVAVATNKATIDQTIGFVPNAAGNQEQVDNFAEDAAHAAAKLAQSQYGVNAPQNVIDEHVAAAKASVYKTQIQTLAADPKTVPAALTALDRNKVLLGADYPPLLREIQEKNSGAQADAIVKGIIAGGTAPGVVTGQSGLRPQNIPNATGAPNSAGNAVLEMIKGPESAGQYDVLYGGGKFSDLSKFPDWEGSSTDAGPTHAAGAYQFEPATWAAAAKGAGVNDFSPASQDKAAWYLASNTYQQKTGRDLAEDVAAGHTGEIKDALKGQWPSITDKSIAGLNARLAGNGSPSAAGPQNDAQKPPPGFPTREDWIGRIPDGLDDQTYQRVYSKLNQQYSHLMQATSAERAQVEGSYKGGLSMLADGRDFNYDPNQIYRLFPADKAAEMVGNLQDAQTFGQQSVAVRGMSPDQITLAQAQHQAFLSSSQGDGYARQRQLSDMFDAAVQQHYKQLDADPAAYVANYNPLVQQAAQTMAAQKPEQAAALRAQGKPDAYENFTAMVQQEQTRLGVPPEAQHIMTAPMAQQAAQKIMADPEHAHDTMQALKEQWGSGWDAIYRDMSTIGKLPADYQTVGAIDRDPIQAGLLARAAGEFSKNGKTLETLLPPKMIHGDAGIDALIENSPTMRSFMTSMTRSSMNDQQTADVLGSAKRLAYANIAYGVASNPAVAAENAVNAIAGHYDYSMPGGPRVPDDRADAVRQNAALTLQRLGPSELLTPPLIGRPGQATPQDYVAQLRANPTWVSAPDMKSIWLMDGGGRLVRNIDKSPISVLFNSAAPVRGFGAAPNVGFDPAG